jgi:hypothetical protein
MRGVIPIELPAPAKAKLAALQITRMSSEDAARAIQGRLAGFGSIRDRGDQELVDRLAAEANRLAARHRELSAIGHKINQWLMELRGVVLESAPAIAVKLKDGETLVEAIDGARQEIAATVAKLQLVKRSPLPLEDRKQKAAEYVAALGRQARPVIGFGTADQFMLRFKDDVVASTSDVLALACWIQPEAVLDALIRDIEALPMPGDLRPLPAHERLAATRELEAQLMALERKEESLIERAAGEGVEVLRRPDASPAAVLGVVIAAKAARQVA